MVFGRFVLIDARGFKHRIPSKRARCLIVALLLSQEWTADRAWLQSLLWPDRPPENASLSLRQEIRNVRKVLGGDFIVSDETRLRLNRAVVSNDPLREWRAGLTLLDGVRLPGELGDWVRHVGRNWRTLEGGQAQPDFVPAVAFSVVDQSDTATSSGLMLSDLISKGLNDLGRIETVNVSAGEDGDLSLGFSISQFRTAERESLRMALREHPQARLRWSANWHQVLSDLGASGPSGEDIRTKFFQMAFRAQEAAEDGLVEIVQRESRVSSLVLVLQALRCAFSMDPARVAQSAKMLDLADDIAPSGAIHALKALLQTNQIYERSTNDAETAKAQALDHARKALVLEPENGLVRALCSNTLVSLSSDLHVGGNYAREAIDLNPSNPLAWSTLANALVAEGRAQDAQHAAARALEISRFSRNRHWWEMNSSVAAVARGDLAAARAHAQTAHLLAPAFKPPLRFLVMLAYHAHDDQAFQTAKQKLMALEPDFDERHIADPQYPTNALRTAGLAKMRTLWV